MSEMIEEAMEGTEDDELDEEADAEVDKVLYEITDGKLGEGKTDLPVCASSRKLATPWLMYFTGSLPGGRRGSHGGRAPGSSQTTTATQPITQWIIYSSSLDISLLSSPFCFAIYMYYNQASCNCINSCIRTWDLN